MARLAKELPRTAIANLDLPALDRYAKHAAKLILDLVVLSDKLAIQTGNVLPVARRNGATGDHVHQLVEAEL